MVDHLVPVYAPALTSGILDDHDNAGALAPVDAEEQDHRCCGCAAQDIGRLCGMLLLICAIIALYTSTSAAIFCRPPAPLPGVNVTIAFEEAPPECHMIKLIFTLAYSAAVLIGGIGLIAFVVEQVHKITR